VNSPARTTHGKRLARKRDYPIIRFLVTMLHVVAFVCLFLGLIAAAYLWLRAEGLRTGSIQSPPPGILTQYNSSDLLKGAAMAGGIGLLAFIMLGAIGQFLAMQRDRAVNSAHQVRLLEDILELNEELGMTTRTKRVELCEGCGRLGSLHRIESGQWVCRECRRQLRSTP
jgi:hypothetical protein